jgi:hypothetical protein
LLTAALATFPFMPSMSYDLPVQASLLGELWFYRIGHFFTTHVMDDPAWLALIFC